MAIGGPVGTAALSLVTKFKFEIGGALTEANRLTKGLQQVSNQAQIVQDNLKFTTLNYATSVTGLQYGLWSVLKGMVDMSEDLYSSQLKLSTLILGNQKKLSLTPRIEGVKPVPFNKTFDQTMKISENVLIKVAEQANNLGIDSRELVSTFTALNALLVPKGAAGKDFINTKNLTKNILTGAEALNLTPTEAGWQVQTMLQGQAMEGAGLFNRLRLETEEFNKKNMPSAAHWNRMVRLNPAKAIEKLNKAFEQYTERAGLQEARLNKVNTQFIILNNQLRGLNSPLIEFGKVLRSTFIDVLKGVNKWLSKNLPAIGSALTRVFKMIWSDLDFFYIQLNKLTRLGPSFDMARNLTMKIAYTVLTIETLIMISKYTIKLLAYLGIINLAKGKAITGVLGMISIFNITSKGLIASLSLLSKGAGFLLLKALKFRKQILTVGGFLVGAILKFVKIWAGLFAIMRVFDSARSHAELKDIKGFKGGELAKFAGDLVISLNNLIAPFRLLLDLVGEFISPLFSFSFWLMGLQKALGDTSNSIVSITKLISMTVVSIFAFIYSSIAVVGSHIKNLFDSILNIDFSGFWERFKQINEMAPAFLEQTQKTLLNRLDKQTLSNEKAPVAQNLNIYNNPKFEIRNQFPENMEPDRIAQAIEESFSRVNENQVDTTSSAKSFYSGSLGSGAGLGG